MLKGMTRVRTILDSVLVTGAGNAFKSTSPKRTVQAIGKTSAGVGAASIFVQASNDGTNWVTIDTLSLTLGTTITSDHYTEDLPWKYIRANVNSISGTDAEVSVFLGEEVVA